MFKRKGHIPPAATYREVWSKGDAADKLSFFVMGASALKHKQWAKGISLLATEIVFFVWLFTSGLHALGQLPSLGAVKTKKVVFDSSQGVYVTKQPDNSVLILLFGVLAVFLVIGFIYLYVINLRSVRYNYVLKREGKRLASNKEELHSLLDQRLHAT